MAVGVLFGLVPGTHINNIIPLILSFSYLLSPSSLAVFIASLAVTQIFISYINSVFLGAPNENTSLSVLPGHKLLLEGRGYEAIKLTVIGGVCSLLVSLMVIAIFANYFTLLYEISRPYIQYPIAIVIVFMIFSEKKAKKILAAAAIVLLSGFLGILVLGSSLVPQQNVMFPLLAGLFGLSTIVVSIKEKSRIPEQQKDDKVNVSKKDLAKSILLGSFAGIVVGFLPAIGVSQAATMVQYLGGMGDARNFLVTLSGINTANEVFSLSSLYLVGNPRSGASVAIGRILPNMTVYDMLTLAGSVCLASGLASLATLYLGKRIPRVLVKINYTYLSTAVMIFFVAMIFVLTGVYGLLIAFTSTAVGLLCITLGVRRSSCMGCLLVPSVLFFSRLNPTMLSFLRL